MLNVTDLRSLSRQELEDKIIALKKTLFEMVSQKETGRIEKPSDIKKEKGSNREKVPAVRKGYYRNAIPSKTGASR